MFAFSYKKVRLRKSVPVNTKQWPRQLSNKVCPIENNTNLDSIFCLKKGQNLI